MHTSTTNHSLAGQLTRAPHFFPFCFALTSPRSRTSQRFRSISAPICCVPRQVLGAVRVFAFAPSGQATLHVQLELVLQRLERLAHQLGPSHRVAFIRLLWETATSCGGRERDNVGIFSIQVLLYGCEPLRSHRCSWSTRGQRDSAVACNPMSARLWMDACPIRHVIRIISLPYRQ